MTRRKQADPAQEAVLLDGYAISDIANAEEEFFGEEL